MIMYMICIKNEESNLKNNANYKLQAVIMKGPKTFDVCDAANLSRSAGSFKFQGTIKKLHARSAGSFKILARINDNAYVIYLPKEFGISSTFKVKDLIEYQCLDFNHTNPLLDESRPLPPLPDILPSYTDKLDNIRNDEIISTQDGGIWRYLICLKGKSYADDA